MDLLAEVPATPSGGGRGGRVPRTRVLEYSSTVLEYRARLYVTSLSILEYRGTRVLEYSSTRVRVHVRAQCHVPTALKNSITVRVPVLTNCHCIEKLYYWPLDAEISRLSTITQNSAADPTVN